MCEIKRKIIGVLVFSFTAILLFALPSYTGGPLSVRPGFNGTPDTWDLTTSIQGAPVGIVPFRTDLGSLGNLPNAEAVTLTNSFFQKYEDIPAATILFQNQGDILSLGTPGSPPAGQPVDVNSTNFAPYLTSSTPLGQNIIIFDADGLMFDAIFGLGTSVLGFVAPSFLSPTQPFFVEAFAAYNGRFLDGNVANGELALNSFRGVFTHETGHFLGLDHSQINGQVAQGMAGGVLPLGFTGAELFDLFTPFTETLYPFFFTAPGGSTLAANGFPDSGFFVATLSMDENIAVSNLYPDPTILAASASVVSPTPGSPFGSISGTIFNTDGTTPVSGVNLVVRRIDQGPFPPPPGTLAYPPTGVPATDADGVPFAPPAQAATDSLATAASVVSGVIDPGFAAGPFISPGNGTYQINGLPPGNYLVAVESIDLAFQSGSRVGQFGPPLQLVIEEYYNGASESNDPAVDNPSDFVPVTVVAGQVTSGINVTLNSVPPTNETEPNDTVAEAIPITLPTTVVGNISLAGEFDHYSFTANAGEAGLFSVRAQRIGSTLDPVLDLLDSAGNPIATNDDTFGVDSFLTGRAPFAGTFILRVRGFSTSTGPYELDVSRINPLPSAAQPVIAVTPASLDFGDVPVGGSADLNFTVENNGGGNLTGNASTSGPFSIFSGDSYLTTGQTQIVTVRFSPTSAGTFVGSVNFTGGGGVSRTVTGTGVEPVISVTPDSLDFGLVTVGNSADLTFTVQNTDGGTLTGDATTSPPYTIVSGGSYNLTSGQTQTVTIRFSPTSGGTFTESVDFTGGGGASQTVTGTGVGVNTITPGTVDLFTPPPAFTITGGGFNVTDPTRLPVVSFEQGGILVAQAVAAPGSTATSLTVPFPTSATPHPLAPPLPGLSASAGPATVRIFNEPSPGVFAEVGSLVDSLTVVDTTPAPPTPGVTSISPATVDLFAPGSFTIAGTGFDVTDPTRLPVVSFEQGGILVAQAVAAPGSTATSLTVPFPTGVTPHPLAPPLPGLSASAGPATVRIFNEPSPGVFAEVGSLVDSLTVLDTRPRARFVNTLLICVPNCVPFTARLTASEGFTWTDFSDSNLIPSPYQPVTNTISNFTAVAVEFPGLGSLFFPGTFTLQNDRNYTLVLTLVGGAPALGLVDEGPITALAPQQLGTPGSFLRGQQEGEPAIQFAPLQDKMREPSVR